MKSAFVFIFIVASISVIAQDKKLLFYSGDWQPATEKKYTFLIEQKKIGDTCYEWNYYEDRQPRYLSIQFKNAQGGTLHGRYIRYTYQGFEDSSGYYYNGKKHGEWDVMASNHRLLKRLLYHQDVLVATKDSFEINKEWELYKDSLKKTRTDTVEIESKFPGGLPAWRNFIAKNFRYPETAMKRNVEGTVYVQFVIDAQGRVTSVDINKSAEYYLDTEALRLISSSPDWKPAVQSGKNVKSYKRQPVIFRLE